MRATPDLVAHRGYALRYGAALAAGAKYFECDMDLIETCAVGELLGELCHVRDPRP